MRNDEAVETCIANRIGRHVDWHSHFFTVTAWPIARHHPEVGAIKRLSVSSARVLKRERGQERVRSEVDVLLGKLDSRLVFIEHLCGDNPCAGDGLFVLLDVEQRSAVESRCPSDANSYLTRRCALRHRKECNWE